MAKETKVEVINRLGWRKEFVLEKPMVQIGRDPRNDIVLDDGLESEIVARHAQLLPSTVNPGGMRLINLSEREITIQPQAAAGRTGAAVTVGPRLSGEVAGGDQVKIGEFTLIVHGGELRSEVMRLSVEMPATELTPDRPLAGTLTIHHVGNMAAVQFKIELEGLDPDSFEVGPGPVLFPNADKQVSFRLMHSRRAYPPAGEHRITFHVTAPDAYPGERASITQTITVAPFVRHKMRVIMAGSSEFHLA